MTRKMTGAGLAAALLLAALPLAARAADLPAEPYQTPNYGLPESYAANWSGLYLGLNAGYGFGSSDWESPVVSLSPDGFVGGGTLGFNIQTGALVWGVEGDLGYSGMTAQSACGAGSCETRNDWLATGRMRFGYSGWNNWLAYVTGGGAFGDVKASNAALGSMTNTQFGWAAGAGLEYAMLANWSMKFEYLYVDLGGFDCTACTAAGSNDVDFKANLVRAGLNYRF